MSSSNQTARLPRRSALRWLAVLPAILALASGCKGDGSKADAGTDAGTDSDTDTFPVSPCVIYVDGASGDDGNDGAGWATAVATVQAGIDLAAPGGCAVWVAATTTYRPTTGTDRAATIQLAAGVAVAGGFSGEEQEFNERDPVLNPTILSGDIGTTGDSSDNSFHVVTGADDAALDGFVVRGGNADGEFPDSCGGGLLNLEVSPFVRACTFTDNHAAEEGGAIYNVAAAPELLGCAFDANSAVTFGGAIANYRSSPLIEGCYFDGNEADNGGAINNYDESHPMLLGCYFAENSATNIGGAIYNETASSPGVINNLFTANSSAFNGGTIYNYDGSHPAIGNCTFIDNATTLGGGAVYNNTAGATIVNSILWNNTPMPIAGEAPVLSYTAIDDSTYDGVDGNFDLDPQLTATHQLAAGSPCIDSADDRSAPAADRIGNERVDDPEVDNCATTGDPECDWFADRGAHELGGTMGLGNRLCGDPESWSNDHRYWFCNAPVGWSAAAAYCRAIGGYLVSVTSSDENAFVAEGLALSTWLGASDASDEGSWEWTDGSAFDFDAWGTDQPDDGASGNCLALDPTDGSWTDEPCAGVRPFVCEADE